MGQVSTHRRRIALTGGLAGVALLLGGCGNVVFNAPKVSLVVQDEQIVFAGPEDAQRLVGGETVLRLANDSRHPHQLVLARLDGSTPGIPPELMAAEVPRDDDRILGMSHVMDPKEAVITGTGVAFRTDRTSFHIHMRAGGRYVVFDRLGGIDRGVVIHLEPGPPDERRAER